MRQWNMTKRSTGWEASLNLISCIVSSGIVSLPYAIESSGLLLGPIVILFVGIAISFSIQLLLTASLERVQSTHGTTYPHLMSKSFGPSGAAILSISQLALSFGSICVDLIMIGDNMSNLLFNFFVTCGSGNSSGGSLGSATTTSGLQRTGGIKWIFLCERYFLIPVVAFLLILPLSLIRHVRDFAKVSFIAVAGSVLLVVGVLVASVTSFDQITTRTAKDGDNDKSLVYAENLRWFKGGKHLYDTISVSCFSFICHGVVFSVYNSLKVPSLSRFVPILNYSFLFCYSLFLIIGIAGYVRFGDQVDGNILNNFDFDNRLVNIVRCSYTTSLITSIPLEIFIIRQVVQHYYCNNSTSIEEGDCQMDNDELEYGDYGGSNWINFSISLLIVVMATLIGVFMRDVRSFLSIFGGLAGTCIGLIFPAACYLWVTQKGWRDWRVIGAISILVLGVWIFGYSLVDCGVKIGSLFERRIVQF